MESPIKPSLSDFSARIKNIYIELKDYQFFHSPYKDKDLNERDGRFIGRKTAKNKIKMILENSKTKSGAYLVAGFRGMGKTSMVRMAVEEYNHTIKQKNIASYKKEIEEINHNCLKRQSKITLYSLITYLISILIGWRINTFTTILFLGVFFLFILKKLVSVIITSPKKNSWYPVFCQILTRVSVFAFRVLISTTCIFLILFLFNWLGDIDVMSNIKSFIKWKFWDLPILLISVFIIIGFYFFTSFLVYLIDYCINPYFKNIEEKEPWSKERIYQKFEINLSQEDVTDVNSLKRITTELLQYWRKVEFYDFRVKDIPIFKPLFFLAKQFIRPAKREIRYSNILNRLSLLSQRLESEVTSEQRIGLSPQLTVGTTMPIGRFNTPLGGFSKNQKISYPIANSKEIEDELTKVLEDIEELRQENPKLIPDFLFIIDELDKIAPNRNPVIDDRELSDPAFDDGAPMGGTSNQRKRQEAVGNLLANLKGFLNIAPAKFIFIGGREMYDATLADIADRDSFYSSVFNQVIYVNSFFKDKTGDRAGITQMAEHYLCKLILSDLSENRNLLTNTKEKIYDLKRLYRHLNIRNEGGNLHLKIEEKEVENSIGLEYEGKKSVTDYLQSLMKYKVIFTLQSYIIYLTYRSNGTPKKLAALTENIIRKIDLSSKKEFEKDSLVVTQANSKSRGIYMGFKFDFQYEIGLTANIYRPYIIINSRHLKALGDKLLFSSSFIFDHIIKFHAFGFSWRNLELIPEVILVNKEPNLRAYIEELMRFLLRTHIRNTVSGIYQYSFYNKVKTELGYLSKISDLSSAAFNFTLDESLQIKRHYKRKLAELEKNYRNYKPIDGNNNFIHSIGFVHGILGDLHFYDKEYDEALVHYVEAMEPLRLPFSNKLTKIPITRHQFFNWLRSKLQAALTLEKMREYNSAFSYYNTLCKDIPYFIKNIVDPKDVMHKQNSFRNLQMMCMPFVAYLGVVEKFQGDGITFAALREKERELRKTLKIDKNDVPIGYYEDKIGVIQGKDYYRKFLLLADFYNNVGSILFYKNCLYPTLFKTKGEILHGLEEFMRKAIYQIYEKRKDKIQTNQLAEKNEPDSLNDELADFDYSRNIDFQPSLSAFVYYYQAARYLCEFHRKRLIKLGKKYDIYVVQNDVLGLLPLYLLPESKDFINSERYYYIANVLSKLGDTVLGSLTIDHRDEEIKLENILDLVQNRKSKKVIFEIKRIFESISNRGKKDNELFNLRLVFDLYQLAGAFYLRSGREQSYGYQYRKMFYVIREIHANRLEDKTFHKAKFSSFGNKEFADNLKEIAQKLFYVVTWTSNVSNRPQILKYRDIFNIENPAKHRSIIYNNINNTPENREVVLLVESIIQIRRTLGVNPNENKVSENFLYRWEEIKEIGFRQKPFVPDYIPNSSNLEPINVFKDFFISPYSSINHRYIRILELDFRAAQFYHLVNNVFKLGVIFKKFDKNAPSNNKEDFLFNWDMPNIEEILKDYEKFLRQSIEFDSIEIIGKVEGNKSNLRLILEFAVKESIFCLREIIRTTHIYGLGNFISYSFLASTHERLGFWCQAYRNLKLKFNLDKKLLEVIGNNALAYLEPNFHFEEAIQHYHKAVQMHREGRVYKNRVLNQYMLEDDYNDNLNHFILGIERFRVNSGRIRARINVLGELVRDSKVYEYNSYHPLWENSKERDI